MIFCFLFVLTPQSSPLTHFSDSRFHWNAVTLRKPERGHLSHCSPHSPARRVAQEGLGGGRGRGGAPVYLQGALRERGRRGPAAPGRARPGSAQPPSAPGWAGQGRAGHGRAAPHGPPGAVAEGTLTWQGRPAAPSSRRAAAAAGLPERLPQDSGGRRLLSDLHSNRPGTRRQQRGCSLGQGAFPQPTNGKGGRRRAGTRCPVVRGAAAVRGFRKPPKVPGFASDFLWG